MFKQKLESSRYLHTGAWKTKIWFFSTALYSYVINFTILETFEHLHLPVLLSSWQRKRRIENFLGYKSIYGEGFFSVPFSHVNVYLYIMTKSPSLSFPSSHTDILFYVINYDVLHFSTVLIRFFNWLSIASVLWPFLY